MKIIATFATENVARRHLESNQFREFMQHDGGFVFMSKETYDFVLLHYRHSCWEVHEPEAHEGNL